MDSSQMDFLNDASNPSLFGNKAAFSFGKVNENLAKKIMRKFTYSEAAQFEQCSKLSAKLFQQMENFKFPLEGHIGVKIEHLTVINDDYEKKKSIPWEDVPENVTFVVCNVEFKDQLKADNAYLSFLKERTRGVKRFIFYNQTHFGDAFLRLLKEFKVPYLNIKLGGQVLENRPYDFSDCEEVIVEDSARNYSMADMFLMKAKHTVSLYNPQFTLEDFINQLKRWKLGAFEVSQRFVIHHHNVEFEHFQTELSKISYFYKKYVNHYLYDDDEELTQNVAYKWILKRSDCGGEELIVVFQQEFDASSNPSIFGPTIGICPRGFLDNGVYSDNPEYNAPAVFWL